MRLTRREFIKQGALFLPVTALHPGRALAGFGYRVEDRGAVPAAGSVSYVLSEDCEGTGQPSGWTSYTSGETTGSVNWDYATSPAPLVGSHSVRLTSNGQRYEYKVFGATNPCHAYWQAHLVQANSSDHSIMHFDDADINGILIIRQRTSTGYARITDLSNSTNHDSTYALSTGTTYHFWLDHAPSGTVDLYISTTATKPASPVISFTVGSSAALGMIAMSAEYSGINIYEKLRASTSVIGSSPS